MPWPLAGRRSDCGRARRPPHPRAPRRSVGAPASRALPRSDVPRRRGARVPIASGVRARTTAVAPSALRLAHPGRRFQCERVSHKRRLVDASRPVVSAANLATTSFSPARREVVGEAARRQRSRREQWVSASTPRRDAAGVTVGRAARSIGGLIEQASRLLVSHGGVIDRGIVASVGRGDPLRDPLRISRTRYANVCLGSAERDRAISSRGLSCPITMPLHPGKRRPGARSRRRASPGTRVAWRRLHVLFP